MWNWYANNGVWILIVSAVILFLLLFTRVQVQNRAQRAGKHKWSEEAVNRVNLSILVVGAIVLVVAVSSLVSIVFSKEVGGVLLTPLAMQKWLLEHGVIILIIVVVSYLVYRFLRFLIPEIIERSIQVRGKERRVREEVLKRARTLSGIISNALGALIGIAAVFMILSELGINIAPLLAGAGVVGIAIGFGAQSLVKDIFSGIFIILEDQYSKGDVVRIAGVAGLVEDINLRRTVLRDLDGIVHIVPNGEIRVASNFTKEWARVNLNVPVAYGENLDKVIGVLNRVGEELAKDEEFGKLIKSTPQVVGVDNFADSAIEVKVLGDTKPSQQWTVTRELRKRIKEAFDKEGIEIPWPHVKLYFGQNPPYKMEPEK